MQAEAQQAHRVRLVVMEEEALEALEALAVVHREETELMVIKVVPDIILAALVALKAAVILQVYVET